MGEVYRARDEKLQRDVALKLLQSRLANQPAAVARFVREAQAASALNHPNIITIFDAGEDEAGRFIVMEFVRGQTLRALVGKDIEFEKLLRIVSQIAKALSAAHAGGVVHRDIKPENIMVRDDGYVKVVDFGLARWEVTEGDAIPRTHTADGTLLGTLRYMSPEQASGHRVRAATDIFSLGIVLYEIVTGKHPFHARNELEILEAIRSRPILPPTRWRPQIPPAFERLILRMLDRDVRSRVTTDEIVSQLEEIGDRVYLNDSEPAELRQPMVGRHRERVQLQALLDSTLQGTGLMVLIEGEPGMGKTMLVENFLEELMTTRRGCAIGRGLCSERLAGTEAFLPFLEALEDLSRGTASVAHLMKRMAPDWYTQVGGESTEEVGSSLAGRFRPASRELLNRELGNFLEEASKTVPLVLFLDDLHWADEATLDLLAYIANRFDSTRILIVANYRPEEALLNNPRFIQITRDLEARRRCRRIVLDFLSIGDVERYLALNFPVNSFPPAFSRFIHAKTEGAPFFMVEVLRYLRDKQFISEVDGAWTLSEKLPEIERDLPPSVAVMIQRKVDFLSELDRQLLAAASVQGYEFDSPVVARVLELQTPEVEDRLDKLERVHGLIHGLGEKELPNHLSTSRYRFVHIFYQRQFYGAIRPSRKTLWSATIANTLVEFYRNHSDVAAQVAVLYETAHEYPHAAKYFKLASRHAAGLFAYTEAVLLARRGLRWLKVDPEKPVSADEELGLLLALGLPLKELHGYGNLEVQQTYDRARELCFANPDSPHRFPVFWGLFAYYVSRLELTFALDIAEQMMRLAQNSQDRAQLLGAHLSMGVAKFFGGRLESSLDHFRKFEEYDDPAARVATARNYGLEFSIVMRSFASRVLWYLGYPDQCVQLLNESLAFARTLAHAPTLAMITSFAGLAHQMRGEVEEVERLGEDLLTLGNEHKLQLWTAEGLFLKGWVQARREKDKGPGIDLMRDGLTSYCATGTEVLRPSGCAVVAELLGTTGHPREGLEYVREVLKLPYMNLPHSVFYTADLARVEGDLLAALGDVQQGEARLLQALQVARNQKAKSYELRAAMSLAKLWRAQNKADEARNILAGAYEWFSEGFETADLRLARSQLQTMSATAHGD